MMYYGQVSKRFGLDVSAENGTHDGGKIDKLLGSNSSKDEIGRIGPRRGASESPTFAGGSASLTTRVLNGDIRPAPSG